MKIELKLFPPLNQSASVKAGQLEIETGKKVSDLLQEIGILLEAIGILSINGRRVDPSTCLKKGDVLAIFPHIEGG